MRHRIHKIHADYIEDTEAPFDPWVRKRTFATSQHPLLVVKGETDTMACLRYGRSGTAASAIGPTGFPSGGPMSQYIDAIVIPVPRANLDTYKRMSREWGNAHVSRGALYYSDAISDDAQSGKVTSFPQAVQLKDGEVIALAWVVYRSKEDRDRISKAVMEDPKLKESMAPSKMPFDGKRMFWGGFETIIGLPAGH